MPRPRLDPELEGVLRHVLERVPSSLTVDLIPSVRATAGQFAPSDSELHRDGAIVVEEVLATGSCGGPDVPLLVCRPRGVSATDRALPAVYYIHGGGMVMGNNRTGLDSVLDWVETFPLVLVSVEYRLAPEHPHPAPIQDCFDGLEWTASHAAELGIDAGKIILAGGSAGGGLAAGLALMARDGGGPALAGQLLMAPMIDDRSDQPSTYELIGEGIWDRISNLTGWGALLGESHGGPDVSVYAAPARASDLSGLPATYIDVGSVDTLRDESVDFAARIWRAGGSAELHVWSGAFHGFDQLASRAAVSIDCRRARQRWLRRVLDDAV